MTGTIRKHPSRRCNKRVNHEKEWKRSRVVSRDCERWVVRSSAWRRPFDYIHGRHHGHVHEERHRAFRYADSARKRHFQKCQRRDHLDNLYGDSLRNQSPYEAQMEDEWDIGFDQYYGNYGMTEECDWGSLWSPLTAEELGFSNPVSEELRLIELMRNIGGNI